MKTGAPISNRKADCHPDRKHHARGFCKQCYVGYKNSVKFVPIGRKRLDLICGHYDKAYVGKGLCTSCYSKHLRETDPKYSKEVRRNEETKRRYGITIDQRDQMIKSQNGACAICEKKLGGKIMPHIDHCHETGVIRGVLCFTCNKSLGMFGDKVSGLQRAIDYLNNPRTNHIVPGFKAPGQYRDGA